MEIGKYLIKARKLKGLSQEDVSGLLNVSRQSVSLWECDQTVPSLDNLLSLSRIYNVSVAVLTGQEEFDDEKINEKNKIEIDNEILEKEIEASYKRFLIISFIFLAISTLTYIVPVLSTIFTTGTIIFSILSIRRKKTNLNLFTLIFGITLFIASLFAYANASVIYNSIFA